MLVTAHRLNRTLPWLVGLLCSGCGLADYEARMAGTAERQRYLEAANQYLGPPLRWQDLPPRAGQDPPPSSSDLFLRPPKEIVSEGLPKPYAPLLYYFPAQVSEGSPPS